MTVLKYAVGAWILGILIVVFAPARAATAAEPIGQQPSQKPSTAPVQTAGAAPASEAPAATSGVDQRATMMDVEAIEAELDLLVTKMNDSEGKAKIDAMADLLATLVHQHRAACAAKMGSAGATKRLGAAAWVRRRSARTDPRTTQPTENESAPAASDRSSRRRPTEHGRGERCLTCLGVDCWSAA